MNLASKVIALALLVAAVAVEADHPGRGAVAPTRNVRKVAMGNQQQPSKGWASLLSQESDDNGNSRNNNKNQNQNDYNDNSNDDTDNDYNDNSNSNSNSKNTNNNDDYNDNTSNDNDYVSSSSSSSQNVQQQQSSSGSYGASSGSGSAKAALDSNNVASVIRVQEAADQSLKTLYNNNAQTLVDLYFGPDFDVWNPRLNGANGSWQWANFNNENNQVTPADNAVLQRVNANGKVVDSGPYASAHNSAYENSNNQGSYATLSTLPFGSETYFEGYIKSTDTYSIGVTQKFVARMLFSCRTVDVDKNPYPKQYVTDDEDDDRLANCAFDVLVNTTPYAGFYVSVTNKGVWAVYLTGTFLAKRRIGARARYDSLVDVAIEIDGRTNTATFFLNGYNVWTIYQIGTLPPADGYTKIDMGATGSETVISLDSGVYVAFGTEKCLDESNPWNQSDTTRLARIRRADDPDVGAAKFYGDSSMFYDAAGERGNLTWGQGAVMTLYKLKVIRTTSVAPRPVVLPGLYGSAAPVYQSQQQQSTGNQNDYNNQNINNNRYQNDNNNNINNDGDSW